VSELNDALRRRAEVGPGRGATEIYAAALVASSRRHHTRPPKRLVALAALAVVIGLAATAAIWATHSSQPSEGHATNPPAVSLPPPATIDTSGPAFTTFTDPDARFTVALPSGWSATTQSLTGLTDPVERLTAASYPLQRHAIGQDDLPACQVPIPAAITDAGSSGAFATILEATDPTGPNWVPDHLIGDGSFADVPSRLDSPLCTEDAVAPGSDVRWIWFGDGHRFFYLAVAIGPDASSETRADLWRMLDSFRPA